MTTFTTDGFLSDEIAGIEGAISENCAEKLDLARASNREAHSMLEALEMRRVLPDLLLGTLLGRQMTSFQAFLILLQKGLVVQAQILLRNLAEGMFIVGAIGKDNEDIDEETSELIETLKETTEDITTFKTERIAPRSRSNDG